MSCPKRYLAACLPKSIQKLLGDFYGADEVMIEAEDYIDDLHVRIGELEAIKNVTQGDIKEWIDANVYDGESVRDQSDKVIFRGDQLQELVIEMYDDLTMLNLGDMDNVV